ncbi:MAG: FlgD immunoglobulin-like domain containing protein [Candidatus Krumholzibacteriota bacterium]
MKARNFLILPGLAVFFCLLAFSLMPDAEAPQETAARLAKPDISAPAPPDFDPSRKQEGGPDQRRHWNEIRLADPATGRIPADIHRREQEFARKLPSRRGSALLETYQTSQVNKGEKINGWGYRGPWNIGGRTRALALDISDPTYQTLLAGGISGGMWRTTNEGGAWTLTTGSSQLHSVSTVAQDTRAGSQNVWYYGTGEVRGNSAGTGGAPFRGDGMFKSTDGGLTWALLPATSGTPPSSFTNLWQYVWRVAIDPSNVAQDEVYAAIYGQIMRSTDGGNSFTDVLGDPGTLSRYTDVIVSSTGVVYASLSTDGGTKGIFRSPDGVTWTDITPAGLTGHGRVVMGLAPSNENIMYCEVADRNGTTDEGFYKYMYLSGDGSGAGGFWQDRSAQMAALPGPSGNGPLETYGSYCMTVTVHPSNPDIVYLGGIHLYRSTDGFATNANDTWIGGWQYFNHHADQHYMIFVPGSLVEAFTGSDGGVHKTTDATAVVVNWTSLNNGYNTSQFYTAAIDENLPGSNVVVGGMQDNGSWFTSSTVPTVWWTEAMGGDGSYLAVADASGTNGTYLFSYQNGYVYRFTLNNSTGNYSEWTRIDPTGGGSYLFINPFIVDPNNTKMLYVASNNGVWRNSDYTAIPLWSNSSTAVNWTHLTGVPASESVTALAMSRSADRILYYGTAGGRVYRLNNADTAPMFSVPTQLNMGPSFTPGSYVSNIAVHPDDDQKVLLGVSNYNAVSLFYTEDGGATWTTHEGNLAGSDGPSVRDVAIVPYGGIDIYFVATSTGLYSSYYLTGPTTWWNLEAPDLMGNVVVDMLATRPADGLVVAGTHGKGVYSIDIPVGTSVDNAEIPTAARLGQNVPNPFNPMTTISFNLAAAGKANLSIYDVAGKRIRTLVDMELEAGDHRFTWNGTDQSGRPAAAGVYLYRLDSGAVHDVKRMTLVR